MFGFLRRLAFVIAFMPFAFLLFLRWLATGRDVIDTMRKFEDWANQ